MQLKYCQSDGSSDNVFRASKPVKRIEIFTTSQNIGANN